MVVPKFGSQINYRVYNILNKKYKIQNSSRNNNGSDNSQI